MKKIIDYGYLDSKQFKMIYHTLKEYCTVKELNYNSVKSGLSRYRKNLLDLVVPHEKSAASESPDPEKKIPKKKIAAKLVPTYNDLHRMMTHVFNNHADKTYWDNHAVKNRAIIDRVLNWVRDFQQLQTHNLTHDK